MQQYRGVLLMLVLCSTFAGIVFVLINRDESRIVDRLKKYLTKSFCFYFFINYFLMSAMKFYLGYQKENLFESFWDIQGATYIHYGVILLIVGIVFPILLHLSFRGKEWQIIKFFDSIMFFVLFFTYFIVRKINNPIYCIAFIIAVMLTLISLSYIMKNDVICAGRKDWKIQAKQAVPVLLYWIVTIVIYIPNELYLSNSSDFSMSYGYFFGKILQGGIILLAVSIVGVLLLLTKKAVSIFCSMLFALLTTGYLQGMLLNGQMTVLDGTAQTWSNQQQVWNLIIWGVIVVTIVVFSVKKKEKTQKIITLFSVYLVLIQVVSLGILLLTSGNVGEKKELALTRKGITEIGDKNNVIVFVLDRFDGLVIDEILEEDPEFINPLHDFTYYRNATSAYAPTARSVPFLLTGVHWKEGTTVEEMWEYAYQGDTLLSRLAAQDYDISVYTDSQMVSASMKDVISNYEDGIERECSLGDLLNLMMQCSKYRMAPFIMKNYYQYDTYDIASLTADDYVYTWGDDLPLYNSLMGQGLNVVSNKSQAGTFKFIHMYGSHPPYTMTEEYQYIEYDAKRDIHIGNKISQSRGAMKIVYEYIRQMKELGKYDDATIIITADHGHMEDLSDEQGNMIATTIPILFIKEPYDESEEIQISETPVCHDDLIHTIEECIGLEVEEKTCSEILEDENRVRRCVFRDVMYQIEGNVRDIESWSLAEVDVEGAY